MVCVTLYHSFNKQGILIKQILSETPKELRYIQRPVLLKDVNHECLGTFELVSQQEINVPMWTIVGFQQRNRRDSQNQKRYLLPTERY